MEGKRVMNMTLYSLPVKRRDWWMTRLLETSFISILTRLKKVQRSERKVFRQILQKLV